MTLTYSLLAPALMILLLCWLNRRLDAPEDQPFELRHMNLYRDSFILGVLGFAAIAVGLPLTTGETEYSPYLAGMALFASLFAPFGFLSCIRWGDGGLTIRTFFGRVHALRWEDVTTVQPGAYGGSKTRQDGYIIADGRRFNVSYAMPDAEDFIARAQRECRKRGIDPAPPRKDDVFHGNIYGAGTILFGWWFVGILFVLCGGMMVFFSIRNPEEAGGCLMMAAICAGALIWWILRCLRGVKVGREPEKYGRKTFESYFGKGSWPAR